MKKILLSLLVAMFVFQPLVQTYAAGTTEIKVYKNTNTSGISQGYQAGGKIRFDLKTTVNSIQHSKFLNDTFSTAKNTNKANNGGKYTAFAYSCPGYYITRIYSDSNFSTIVGYSKVYVAASNFSPAAIADCDAVTPPTEDGGNLNQVINPTAASPTDPIETRPKTVAPTITPPEEPPTTETGAGCPPNAVTPGFEGKPLYKGLYTKGTYGAENYQNLTASPNLLYYVDCTNKMNYYQLDSNLACADFTGYGNPTVVNSDGYCAVNTLLPATDPGTTDPGGGGTTEPTISCPEDYTYNTTTSTCELPVPPEEVRDIATCKPGVANCYGSMDAVTEDYTTSAESGTNCEMCALFECPGWGDYMFYLNDMVDYAIGDVEVPKVPEIEKPKMPNIFDILNNVDQRNQNIPTGQEDPGLGNASFDANEVKSSAPEIPFREDPTGGFNITNPIDSLPADGSTAPKQELETIQYPGVTEPTNTTSGQTPNPTNSTGGSSSATYPTNSGETIEYPNTGGTAAYPEP